MLFLALFVDWDEHSILYFGFSLTPRNSQAPVLMMANGSAARQGRLNVDALCDTQGIVELYPQVPNGAVDLCVTEQQLNGS